MEVLFGVIAGVKAKVESEAQEMSAKTASLVGLKEFFTEMFLYSGLLVPALDALSFKLKNVVPSFKKKKGALPAQVD